MKQIQRILLLIILLGVSLVTVNAQQEEKEEAKEIKAFVRTIVSKTSIHESDTLTLIYRVYTNTKVNKVLNITLPANNEFRYISLSKQPALSEEVIDGETYYVWDLRSYVLQPRSKLGAKELPAGIIVLEFLLPTGKTTTGFWGNTYEVMKRERLEIEIDAVTIRVHNMMAI